MEGFEIYQGSQYNSVDNWCEWSENGDGEKRVKEVSRLPTSITKGSYLFFKKKEREIAQRSDCEGFWRGQG